MENLEKPQKEIDLEQLKKNLWANYEKNNKKIVEFAQKLKAKYEDYGDYRLWYILAGGTPDYQGEEKMDFPDDDSVEKFINSLD
jgi:hypothetical protein